MRRAVPLRQLSFLLYLCSGRPPTRGGKLR